MGLRQLAQYRAKFSNGQEAPFRLAADPTSGAGGSFAGRAVAGALLVTDTGRLFICTAATATSATWQLAGLQT